MAKRQKRASSQAKSKPHPDLSFEKVHRDQNRAVVGVDEVGRGCLAGPVVTAAVMLPDFVYTESEQGWWFELNDSKLLNPSRRQALSSLIHQHAKVQVAWCSVEEIDHWNIFHAAMVAMRRALEPFSGLAQTVFVDGNASPFNSRYQCPPNEAERLGFTHVEMIVKGDQRSMSIAAASIVAKVYRDRWMGELDREFPGYAFGAHKGYSTPVHYEAIRKLGPCVLHRRSFSPIAEYFTKTDRRSEPCNASLPHEGDDKEIQLFK